MSDVSPEHRFYSVLALLQAATVVVGTFAIRIATTENFRDMYYPAPVLAGWIRNWGFAGLFFIAVWFYLTIRASRRDQADSKLWLRVVIGVIVTLVLAGGFWWIWDLSTRPHSMILEDSRI